VLLLGLERLRLSSCLSYDVVSSPGEMRLHGSLPFVWFVPLFASFGAFSGRFCHGQFNLLSVFLLSGFNCLFVCRACEFYGKVAVDDKIIIFFSTILVLKDL